MFRQLGAGELLVIAGVLVLFFGAAKLPDLARSIGKSARELRKGLQEGEEESEDAAVAEDAAEAVDAAEVEDEQAG